MKVSKAVNRRLALAAFAAIAAPAMADLPAPAGPATQGPSTSRTPYVLPTAPGVGTMSIFTVGTLDTFGPATLDTVNSKSVANGDPAAFAGNPYIMTGIPDGLGIFDNNDGTFTLLANHEFGPDKGIIRAHGNTGAYVSKWIISKSDLSVVSGSDLIRTVNLYNGVDYTAYDINNPMPTPTGMSWDSKANAGAGGYVPFAGGSGFNRLCSADLAAPTAYKFGDLGTDDRIFLNGEESNTGFNSVAGHVFAHVATGPQAGVTWELPHMGKSAPENAVANPFAQAKTIVAIGDDSSRKLSSEGASTADGVEPPSELYLYVGTKQSSTAALSPVEKAGLTNGNLFGVKVTVNNAVVAGESQQYGLGSAAYVGSGQFTLFNHGDVASDPDGKTLQNDSIANEVFQFRRPEDVAWDPRPGHENDLYFTTTDQFDTVKDPASVGTDPGSTAALIKPAAGQVGRSRLWRMHFDDITNPETGGSIEIVLDGTQNNQMWDNLTVDKFGRILLQEDPGKAGESAKIWMYDIATGALGIVAQLDPARFGSTNPADFNAPIESGVFVAPTLPFNVDEESSALIDASDVLGDGWYLGTVQPHYAWKAGVDNGLTAEMVEGGQFFALYVPVDFDVSSAPRSVPEPAGLALLGVSVCGLWLRRRA